MNISPFRFENFKSENIPLFYKIEKKINNSSSYIKFEKILKENKEVYFNFDFEYFDWTYPHVIPRSINTQKFADLHFRLSKLL